MSAAPKIDLDLEIMETLEKVISGDWTHCYPANPFFDLDLSLLVSLDQVKSFSGLDPLHIFGEQVQKFRYEIWDIQQKNEILFQVKSLLENAGCSQSLRSDILNCADEMITNSVFNAPFSKKMNRKLENLRIPGRRPIIFDLSIGEYDLLVSCTDPFGTLQLEPFFRRILGCYQRGLRNSINFGEGGAGIGSFLIFDQCTSFILGLVPGKWTSVNCRFPRKMSSKIRKSLPKNLVIFTRED